MSDKELLSIARKLIKNSYAPYSGFKVASIVITSDGNKYFGVNVENSSYGLSMCAERVAVFNAVTHGSRSIEEVHIFTETSEPVPPCGACRQVIAEFNPHAKIVSYSLKTGMKKEWILSELLPDAFTL